jgi:hypothetical protein
MKFAQRVLILMTLVVVVISWSAEAGGPKSLASRYDDFRERMLKQRVAKQASYEKRERDFSNGDRRKRH